MFTEAVERISLDLEINLDRLIPHLATPEKFVDCCDTFVSEIDAAGRQIEALPFCTFLRKNGFLMEAKTICQWFISTNPAALTKTLAT